MYVTVSFDRILCCIGAMKSKKENLKIILNVFISTTENVNELDYKNNFLELYSYILVRHFKLISWETIRKFSHSFIYRYI